MNNHSCGAILRRGALLLLLALALPFMPMLRANALDLPTDGQSAAVQSVSQALSPEYVILVGSDADPTELTFDAGRKVVAVDGMGQVSYATTRRGELLSKLLTRMQLTVAPLELALVDVSEDEIRVTISTELTYYETETVVTVSPLLSTDDHTLTKGTQQVVQQGSDGLSHITYEVVWADGQLLSRQAVAEEVEIAAVPTIVRTGTLVTEAARGDTIREVITLEDGSGYLLLASGDALHFTGSMNVKCTAYTSGHGGVGTTTYTGSTVAIGCAAVDRSVIPLGTRMFVATNDGYMTYGMACAEDIGVKGAKLDLYMDSYDECIRFGVRKAVVYFLDSAGE